MVDIDVINDTQLMKGILEGCILSVISEQETYGYEILITLEKNGFDAIQEGTLYPILTRLEKRKLISCRRSKSPFGPIRKYYSITEEGIEWLTTFKENYQSVTRNAERVLYHS